MDLRNQVKISKKIFGSIMSTLLLIGLFFVGGCGETSSSASHLGASGDFIAFIAAPTDNAVIRYGVAQVCQNGEVVEESDGSGTTVTLISHTSGGTEPYAETWNVYGTYDVTFHSSATSTDPDEVTFVGKDGIYTISLTVIDGIGRTATDSIQVRMLGYITSTVDPEACAATVASE